MSCEIKSRAIINDLTKVKRVLFPLVEAEDDQWSDDAWQWKVDSEETDESTKLSENWMQECLVSCSPQSEVFVLAHEDRFAVLTSKWEKKNDKEVLKYHLSYPTSSTAPGHGEEITSVLCLPISSLQKSSQGQPDWMCVILGFSTGYVRMYTADGKLLMTEVFQDEPVRQLRFRSSSVKSAQQEFLILYQKTVIIVESLGLFNSLRACRNFLAKSQALYGVDDSQHPPLHYKKFSLQDQTKINECYVLGTSAPCQFDHLVTASIAGGFNARYNVAPPVATGILSIGSQPYLAWHFAIEGSAAPLLTDVAYALASKVTSKIFSKTSGWLGWGGNAKAESGPSKPKEKQINEPATPVYPKFGLADALREATSICVSPNEKLAAVTDSLGRVILIDLLRGIAVRFWKGYREAQCGWVVASETSAEHPNSSSNSDSPSTNRRTVAFLVIYIPKRGLLEIWTTQQGTRVAAFNCCKGARLLNMGGRSTLDKDLPECCLLCPNGKIDEIIVPFHCALKGDSSQKARDLHVLEKFRQQLNTANEANFELLLDIKHASVVSQGFDMLMEYRLSIDPNEFIKCLETVVEQYVKAEALNAESRLLLSRCRLLSRLIRVYVLLKDIQSQPPDYDTATTNASSVSVQEIATLLCLNLEEVSRAIQPRNQFFSKSMDAGTLPLPSMELHTFLRAFDLCIGHGSTDDSIRLSMKSSVAVAERTALGGWIWGTCFARSLDLTDKLALALKESLIVPEDLINLLVSFWLNLKQPSLPKMIHFHKVFRTLFCLFSPEKFSNSDTPNPLWQNVQDLLCKSNNLEQACSAALVCRSVIAEFEKRKIQQQLQPEKGADSDDSIMEVSSLSDWEDMSIDMVQWNVLSKQLEDLTYLLRLIKYKPVKLKAFQRSVLDNFIEETPDELDFTLSSILQKGRGSVTELVARWFTQNLLQVNVVFDHKIVDENADESMSDPDKLPENAPEADLLSVELSEEIAILQGLFNDLSQHLPNSTQHDVVLLSVAVEYAAMWIKNPKCMQLLERSLDTVLPLQSNLLRHGICRTLWSMSLSPIFHDLSVLMDKTGRLPKSFTSRKISLPSTDQVVPFLQITMKLLDTTITSAMSCETEPPPHIRYDDIWPTCEGATPMLEVAIRQRLINIDLVLLHHQLAQVLLLMASLEIKGVHAFSLFDQRVGRFAFFKELHTYPPLPSQQADPTVCVNRLHFLKQVIIKSVEMMEQNQSVALDYVNQSVKLGYEWGVDVDELRIKYVELLYLNDFDHLANEMLPSIAGDEKLASALLNTVGKRLKPLLQPRDTSVLSPMTVAWLDGFVVDMIAIETIPKSRSTNTLSLLIEVLHRLPSDCNDRFIANEIRTLLTSM